MDADLDSLCTAVYVTADDLLPSRPANARRELDDAEVVALAVAQVEMGIPSDRRFLAVARRRLRHLFPRTPGQSGYLKRRRDRLAQPPARTTEPLARGLRGLSAWNQSSSCWVLRGPRWRCPWKHQMLPFLKAPACRQNAEEYP